MSNILETFRPGRLHGYTYAQLLEIKAAGHEVPTNVLARVKQHEDADAEDQALADTIAADLAAAEKARDKERAEKDKRVQPQLATMAKELEELRAAAQEKRSEALDAVKAYRAAWRTAARKHGSMRRMAREEYGDPVKDNNGDALPGQTFAHSDGDVIIQGEKIRPVHLAPEFDEPLLRGL